MSPTENSENPIVRIAVIDDDRMLLNVFSSLMKKSEYHTHFFSNAAAAFEKIAEVEGHYHLVISDIRMPGMDGFEFARKLRAIEPDLPIILISGDAPADAKEVTASLGRAVFLEKPFPLESTLKEFIPKFIRGEA